MQSLKKGYTLLESIGTVAIILILTTIASVGFGNMRESMRLEEGKNIVVETLGRYRDSAYYQNNSYTVIVDTFGKNILVSEKGLGKREEIYLLPGELRYRIPNVYVIGGKLITGITADGNMSNAFTLYIFGKGDRAQYRIGFYTFSQLKYLHINIYRNISADKALFSNIDEYHRTTEAQNHVGWGKIQ